MNLEQLKNCVSIDVETTGIDPEKSGIISIGACFFDTNEEFYQENILREGAEINDRALEVNGETRESLLKRDEDNFVTEYQSLKRLIDFCKNKSNGEANVIIGKNPSFDYKFLLKIWIRNGGNERDFYFSYRFINWGDWIIYDILKSGKIIPLNGVSSDSSSKFLNLPQEEKPHNALNGAKHNKNCVLEILKI